MVSNNERLYATLQQLQIEHLDATKAHETRGRKPSNRRLNTYKNNEEGRYSKDPPKQQKHSKK